MRPLDEQAILITGATDGLGRAVAAELAAVGARVNHSAGACLDATYR